MRKYRMTLLSDNVHYVRLGFPSVSASRNNMSSSRPASCTLNGMPSSPTPTGTAIAGCPVTFHNAVNATYGRLASCARIGPRPSRIPANGGRAATVGLQSRHTDLVAYRRRAHTARHVYAPSPRPAATPRTVQCAPVAVSAFQFFQVDQAA